MQVNFSATPFKSTFKIDYLLNNSGNSIAHAYDVDNFCHANNINYQQEFNNVRGEGRDRNSAIATGTIIADDWKDAKIEDFCASMGICYEKMDYATLVGEDSIIARSVLPPYTADSRMVLLDVEEFEKLIKKHPNGNIDYCEEIYNDYYAKETDNIIKSGDEIEVPALHINSSYLGVEKNALQYGIDSVPDGTMSFLFNQTTDKPNQCLYFAMKNCGMRHVPVAVDQHSFELGQALGIFS